MLKGLRALISFLTRIPTGIFDLDLASKSFYMVPIIGAIEGAVVSAVVIVLNAFLDPVMVCVFYVIAHLVLTGGLHFDGFVDFTEALWSGRRGDEMLKIMKDPRKGVFGVVSAIVNLLISVVGTYVVISYYRSMSLAIVLFYLVLYILSAESMFILSYIGDPEPYDGLARKIVVMASKRVWRNFSLVIVLLIPLYYFSYLLDPLFMSKQLLIVVSMLLVILYTGHEAERRLGYINGDILGFTYELVRIIGLIIMGVVVH